MKKFKKILKIVLTILFILICIVGFLALIQIIFDVDILPIKIAYVVTNSMEPTIKSKSYILIRTCNTSTLKVGDIITFISKDESIAGQLNTHRIVDIVGNNEAFYTKGDRLIYQDTMATLASDVKGVFVCNLPILTALFKFFLTKAGLAVSLGIIVLISFTISIVNIIKSKKDIEQSS